MLKKKNRADTKTVANIFKQGASISSSGLSFRFIKTPNTLPRLSFVVPKSVAKSAVKRNALRRMGYAVLEKHLHKFPSNLCGVFMFKNSAVSPASLENDIKNILSKI